MIVERRDHVLTTFFSNFLFMSSTFFRRWSSTKGPLLIDRAMSGPLRLAAPHDELVRAVVVPRLLALGRDAPRRHRMAAAGGPALPASVRMIHRVHGHTADRGALAHPTVPA